jgi:hypothetical protein
VASNDLGQESHLESSNIKKSFNAVVFKIPSFSSYRLLPMVMLFKKFLKATTYIKSLEPELLP